MNETKIIQSMLTEMLEAFHKFCVEHSIKYYAIGGTSLGAARHHGFIPWDDDLDVGLPRPDYERLIKIFNKENSNKRYVLESPDSSDPFFIYPYSKIYDTQTTLIDDLRHPIKRGIYIDIFPLDGTGNNEKGNMKVLKKIRLYLKIWDIMVTKPSPRRSALKNAILNVSYFLFSCLGIKEKNIAKRINDLCQTDKYELSNYIGFLMGDAGKKANGTGIFPKVFLGRPVLYQFEKISINCPTNTDGYLTSIYHDWRTLPPKEEQVTHHSYYVNLRRTYLD